MEIPRTTSAVEAVTLEAEPEPLQIDLKRTAVVVVDMQNAFCSKGGMFDTLGLLNVAKAIRVIEVTKTVIDAARSRGMKIVYLRMAFRPDLSDTGGLESPHYWKSTVVRRMHEQSAVRGKFMTQGSWDAEIVDEIKPEPDDIVIDKNRYSGFPNTGLDAVLRTYNIKYLVFIGVATNVCVESTLRDAFFREYFPILVSDGCGNQGPDYTQEATIWNVARLFGWVATSTGFINALK